MANKSATISAEFDAIRIALEVLEPLNEAQRTFAITMILSRLGLSSLQPTGAISSTPQFAPSAPGPMGSAGSSLTPKDFLKSKNPATDLERYVCLAYYLTHYRNAQSFSTRDVIKLNAEAFANDFSNAAATATNATRQSKLLSRAGSGKKRITTRGEALVEALPDRTKVKEAQTSGTPKRRKKKKNATK
jgi:hypothetical protein